MAKRVRRDKTDRVLGSLRSRLQKRTPVASDMFLPNHSGDHSAGTALSVPVNDYDLVNKKYVDDSLVGSGLTIEGSDPSPPFEGQLIINSSSHVMKVYYEGSWRDLHTFVVVDDFLLLESGDAALLESGDKIVLEG